MVTQLSILIVNWNTRELLLDCLRSLAVARLALTSEIIVVDNASADNSAEAVSSEFPNVLLLRNDENVGFAAANNQAYRASCGRFVLLLNSDTLVPTGSLERMVTYMEETPNVGVLGPRLEYEDGAYQISALRFTQPWDVFYEYVRFPRRLQPQAQKAPRRLIALSDTAPTSVEYVMGAALMIRRSVVERIGLMDEDYFMYAEEVDWCFRARAAGFDVHYLPNATVTHLGGRSTAQVPDRMLACRFASTFRFMRVHYGIPASLLARGLLALAACQNTVLSLAWWLSGRENRQGFRAEWRRNAVVFRTAIAGSVPHSLQMQAKPPLEP